MRGSMVVLCGCSRAQVLDRQSRWARLAATAAIAATITLLGSGAPGMLIATGFAATLAAIGAELSVARETAAIATAGYCPRCTTPRENTASTHPDTSEDQATHHRG